MLSKAHAALFRIGAVICVGNPHHAEVTEAPGGGEWVFGSGWSKEEEPEVDEPELVRRAQADPAAFDALYGRYRPEITSFVRSRIGANDPHVEDLVSRAFMKALSALPGFRSGSFRGWLYRIVRNVVIDHIRASRPTVPIERADSDMAGSSEGPYEAVARTLAREALMDAMAMLNESQRSIIEMRWQGYTVPQISDQLGMHSEAVKSAQYRAMDKLRRHFEMTGQIRREDL